MGRSKGYRRRTRSLLKKRTDLGGLSRILRDYSIGQKVVIKIDSTQVKGMPHRQVQRPCRRRSRRSESDGLNVDVPVGDKIKTVVARKEHIAPLVGSWMSAEPAREEDYSPSARRTRYSRRSTWRRPTRFRSGPSTIPPSSRRSGRERQEAPKQLETDCGLSAEEAVEVINIMPKSIEELRTFTAGWRKLLPTETLEKMLKILKSAKET